MLFSNINFFASFQLRAIIIVADLLSLNKHVHTFLKSGRADALHAETHLGFRHEPDRVLPLQNHTTERSGGRCYHGILWNRRFQESWRELVWGLLYLSPPAQIGELTSPGKVLVTGSQSLIGNPLFRNWHCLERAVLPIVTSFPATHIQWVLIPVYETPLSLSSSGRLCRAISIQSPSEVGWDFFSNCITA